VFGQAPFWLSYIFGYNNAENFFVYAAQFGRGCIIFGIACEQVCLTLTSGQVRR
jgi:hypothetical protein